MDTTHPQFHIGMRNIKTGLAVLFCLVIYRLLGRDGYFLACTSAIICMQDSVEKSVASGLNRMIGTGMGAILGVALLFLNQALASIRFLNIITATIGIILLIALCNLIDRADAIVIGCVVFLAIVLEQTGQPPLIYGANRLLDTLVGIMVAVIVNRFILNPDRRRPKAQPPEEQKEEPATDAESGDTPSGDK